MAALLPCKVPSAPLHYCQRVYRCAGPKGAVDEGQEDSAKRRPVQRVSTSDAKQPELLTPSAHL